MKNLLLVIMLCLPLFLFSQSQLEFVGSLNVSGSAYGWDGIAGNIRNSDKAKLNHHFNISYNHALQEKLWLKIGLGFSSMGYKTEKIELIFGNQIDSMGNFDPNIPGEFESAQFKYNYHFLEIPIALRYEFSQKKLKPFLELGISTQYYLQSVYKSFLDGQKRSKEKIREENISQIQFAPTVAFGFSYAFNEKWELLVQPNFRYNLTKKFNVTSYQHLWSGGLALGARMALK